MTTQNIPVGPQVDTQFLRSYTFPVTANNKKNIELVLNINILYRLWQNTFQIFSTKVFIIM
jgi:hypothetical protein